MSYTCPPLAMLRNERTQVIPRPFTATPLSPPKAVFTRLHPKLAEIVRAAPRDAGTVVAIHDGATIAAHAHVVPTTSESGSIVIGRHDHAGLSLWRDPTVALRHLLVRFGAGASGRPPLDLLDLNSGQGFDVQGVGRLGAIGADGPLLVRIGCYDLLFVPPGAGEWPEDVALAWIRFAAPVHVETTALERWPRPQRELPRETTVTGRHRALSLLETSQRSARDAKPAAILGVPSPFGGGTTYPLYEEHLQRGILLGRYDRCQVLPQNVPGLDHVSRVHALLIQEGDDVVLYDTGSTHGTYVNGDLVVARSLGHEATLELSKGNVVFWKSLDGAGLVEAPDGGYVN